MTSCHTHTQRIYRKSEMLEEWRMEVQLGLTLDDSASSTTTDAADSESYSGGPAHPYMLKLEPSASCLLEDQMELVGALTHCVKTAALRHVGDCFRLAKVFFFVFVFLNYGRAGL